MLTPVTANVVLPDGSTVSTTCLLKGEFDILAVNVFAFDIWRFVFEFGSFYIKLQKVHGISAPASTSYIGVHWPPKAPFYDEPFTLMNEIVQNRI